MKNSRAVFKILALASSVTLAGCFVAYRAGAFEKRSNPPAANGSSASDPLLPSTKSMELPPQDSRVAADSPVKPLPPEPEFLGSSKNDGIFEPEDNNTELNQPHTNEAFMGTSKSGKIFAPQDTPKPVQVAPVREERFMGSSKSAAIFHPDTGLRKVPNNQNNNTQQTPAIPKSNAPINQNTNTRPR